MRARREHVSKARDVHFHCACVDGGPVCDGHFWMALRAVYHAPPRSAVTAIDSSRDHSPGAARRAVSRAA